MIITRERDRLWHTNNSNAFNKDCSSGATKKQGMENSAESHDTVKNTSSKHSVLENNTPSGDGAHDSDQQNKSINYFNDYTSNDSTPKAKSSSIMSNNFASNERTPSKYIASLINGFQKMREVKNESAQKTLAIMETSKMMYDNAETVGEKYTAIKWAEKNLILHAKKEVVDTAEKTYLKDIKEHIIEELKKLLEEAEGIEKILEEGNTGETGTDETGEAKLTTDPDNNAGAEAEITVGDGGTDLDTSDSIGTGTISSGTGDFVAPTPAPKPSEPTQNIPLPENAKLVSTQSSAEITSILSLNIIV